MPQSDSSSKFISNFLLKLDQDRRKDILCDFEIHCGKVRFPCHLIVLRNRSKLFQFEYVRTQTCYQCSSECSPSAVESLLHFVYTFEFELTNSNVFDLLRLSREFYLLDLEENCLQYLNELNISETNWFLLWSDCVALNITTMKKKMNAFLQKQFHAIVVNGNDEFYDFNFHMLFAVVNGDELVVKEERTVLHVVRRWLLRKPEERAALAASALALVRLPMINLSHREYQELADDPIFGNEACKRLLSAAIEYRLSPSARWELQSPMTRPRPSTGVVETLIAVNPGRDAIMFVWEKQKQAWNQIKAVLLSENKQSSELEWKGEYLGSMVSYDGRLFLVDTEGGLAYQCICVQRNMWMAMAADFIHREGAECVIAGEYLYLIGGSELGANDDPLGTVERMDIHKERWEQVDDLPVPVQYPVVFTIGNQIYVVGGYAKCGKKCQNISHVQVYDCDEEEWTLIEDAFAEPGNLMGAACFDGVIYVLANSGRLYSFDATTLQCKFVLDLDKECSEVKMVVFDSKLVVCRQNKAMYVLDVESKTVTEMAYIPLKTWVCLFTAHLSVSYPCDNHCCKEPSLQERRE